MRKRQLSGLAAVALGALAFGSAPASACDDECGCGYGYYGYYARPAYTYYYAPPAYYVRPAYAYYGGPRYVHRWHHRHW